MNNCKASVLCVVIMFTMAGCIKRHTSFKSQMKQMRCPEITGIIGIVNEDYASGKARLDLDIEWCDSYGRKNCCNKEINHDPLAVVVKIGGRELFFASEKEGVYVFNSSDSRVFKQNEEAEVLVTYKVDSLGIELTRNSAYILYRERHWGYSVH